MMAYQAHTQTLRACTAPESKAQHGLSALEVRL